MAMIGNYGIYDYYYVFAFGTNRRVFNHNVIILIIPAKNRLFQSFEADVKRLNPGECAIGKCSVYYSVHGGEKVEVCQG
jgi:hypothetical protein